MPRTIKTSKEMILNKAFEILREQGLDGINAREIAKRIGCSVQPLFYQFENMDELKKELLVEAEKYLYDYLLKNKIEGIPEYKQVGVNYIKFAQEEKKLFQTLFMNGEELLPLAFSNNSSEEYKELEKLIKISTNLDKNNIKEFHNRMWIFVHGIATLIANKTIKLTEEQIKSLLSYQFQALMLLEENPDNKWVLPNN